MGDIVVSIVIPALDSGPLLAECVSSLPTDVSIEVIVVDNASTDASVQDMLKVRPDVHLVRNTWNMGFAHACNQGAITARGGFVLFLNTDAAITEDSLRHLVGVADADDGAAMWQPLIMDAAGRLEDAGIRFSASGFPIRERSVPPGDAAPYPVFACTGACLLVRRSVFLELGGFDSSFFAYVEDTDLSWRAHLAGWRTMVVPGAQASHIGNATTRKIMRPSAVRYLIFRNRWRMILTNAGPSLLARLAPAYLCLSLATALVLLVRGDVRSAIAIAAALTWPLSRGGMLRARRRAVQSLRRVSDNAAIPSEIRGRLFGGARSALTTHLASWNER